MKLSNVAFTGSINISGSLVLPNGTANLRPSNPQTGSLFVETSPSGSNLLVYNGQSGSGWEIAGIQTEPKLYIPPPSGDIEYLVIAGGGAGGGGPRYYNGGGGGGAGGYLSSSLSSIESGSSISVIVGAGGAGAQNAGGNGTSSSLASTAGTSFTTIAAVGGGGGSSQASGAEPGDGGSGGGACYNSGTQTGGAKVTGQGNNGGDVNFSNVGGAGGGGKGAEGQTLNSSDGFIAGDGGNGEASSITGTSVTRAGGGGGGNYAGMNSDFGTAGTGGGGNGSANGDGSAGTANTGGGGGGSGNFSSGYSGGAGGSGVVVLAYDSGSITATGGIAKSRSDGHVYHTFNSSGTLTIGGPDDGSVLNGDNFGILLYSGDNANPRSITGLGFDPGMVWVKNRHSSGENHGMGDILRSPGKLIYPNLSLTENTGEYITPITDGVKISTGNNNYSGNDYVAWCWKAGGSGVSNSNGSITSTVSANQAAGFSIVTYAGNSASSATIGHGLSSAPQLIWVKGRNVTAGWPTMFNDGSYSNYGIRLNETGVDTNNATVFFNNTAPTNTVFSIGGSDEVNDGYNYVAYCFHSVPGYQKVGSYTGTGSAGLEVTLGFQARFIMVKKVAPSGDRWLIADTSRGPATNNDEFIDATDNLSERDFNCTNGITFGSDSFTVNTTDGSFNSSGGTYIYLAIA